MPNNTYSINFERVRISASARRLENLWTVDLSDSLSDLNELYPDTFCGELQREIDMEMMNRIIAVAQTPEFRNNLLNRKNSYDIYKLMIS